MSVIRRLAGPCLAICLAATLAACTNQPPVTNNPYVSTALTPVSTLALAPGGGALAESVAAQMADTYGFTVLPAATLVQMMQQSDTGTLESPMLDGLIFLEGTGIDAVLVVREGAQQADALATALRVPDGALIAESRFTPRLRVQRWYSELQDDVADLLASGLAAGLNR